MVYTATASRTPVARRRWPLALVLALALAMVVPSCGGGASGGDLQLVVADQTVENSPRDVVEIQLGDGAVYYPDSAAGGSPTPAGVWTAGQPIEMTLWPAASEEAPLPVVIAVPDNHSEAELSIVVEIEDDSVKVRVAAVGFSQSYPRQNPIAEQRAAEADAQAAAAAVAEAAAQAEAEAELEAEQLLQEQVIAIRREAAQLMYEMREMERDLTEILDKHNTVYGDDNWATFVDIASMYRDYTTDALSDLHAELKYSTFDTAQVASANEEWQEWWKDFINIESRAETAARNNDSTAMDTVRAEQTDIWDRWEDLFDLVESLENLTAAELAN